jgi:ComF family protein
MRRWFHLLVDCVFPATCDTCGRQLPLAHAHSLCAICVGGMVPLPPPYCQRCGLPLAVELPCCATCARRPPAFSSARAAALYLPAAGGLNPLAAAVHALKYQRRRRVASALGALLAERYPFGDDVVVVPVPLHPTRLRSRGFNQAVLLARVLARRRGLAVAARALRRVRPTVAQPGLGAAERRRNLRHAFAVREPAAVRGRPVVLVDDVFTTGATADACAQALLAARVTRVDVFTVGRAP